MAGVQRSGIDRCVMRFLKGQEMDIVEEMRGFEIDHEPDGWPGVRMRQVSALCDEIERLRGFVAHLAVPVGWKLVPVRPTEAMMDGLRTGSRKDVPGNPLCEIRWAAALAKTPTHNAALTGSDASAACGRSG